MRIGVCIQSLTRVLTTATPYRGMLRQLLKLRESDQFELYVTQDSTQEPLLVEFLQSLETDNWRLVPLPYNRRTMAIKCLMGFRDYFSIDRDVEILLTSDFDYHKFGRGARIAHLNDLSALFAPRAHCSLPWHGRRMRSNQARLLANSSAFVCAISAFSKSQLVRFDPCFELRCKVVACGIDDQWHAEVGANSHNVPVPEPYWIWWGQITRRKNIDGLLSGYAELIATMGKERSQSLPRIVLVGNVGQDSTSIHDLISQLGISQHVCFFPFQDLQTLIGWVDHSSGVLFPSHFEGFGLPALEGLARGKPVLTSACTSLPEITGEHAILIDPASVSSIAGGLHDLLSANDADGAAARKAWAAKFTYERGAEEYCELIQRLVSC